MATTLLLRTKSALEDCENHLGASGGFGTEIESYLTQYLLVVLCADVQQEIYGLCESRASVVGDEAISAYVVATAKRVLRSVRKDEIGNFVGMFGVAPKAKMNSMLDDAQVTIYNNAVSHRHDVAHRQGAQLTLGELRNAVSVAEGILVAVDAALMEGLNAQAVEQAVA